MALTAVAVAAPLPSAAQELLTYAYDAHGRLISTTQAGQTAPALSSSYSAYTYDSAHNRVTRYANPIPTPVNGDLLHQGEALVRGQFMQSANGVARLTLGADGNLVLNVNGVQRWTSGTADGATIGLSMQGDGYLVLFGPGMTSWSRGNGTPVAPPRAGRWGPPPRPTT